MNGGTSRRPARIREEPEPPEFQLRFVLTWYAGSNVFGIQQEDKAEVMLNVTTLKRLAAIGKQLSEGKDQ
jgi:hypothetical protein